MAMQSHANALTPLTYHLRNGFLCSPEKNNNIEF